MKDINNKGRVNRFKYLLYFYGLFVLFMFVYTFIIAPDLPRLILLAAFAPLFGFMSSFVNWPVYVHATEADGGVVINTQKLFSKKRNSLVVTKYNFDSYFETDHLHIGLNVLDEEEKLRKHRIKVSWLGLKDLRALEEKLKEINPYAPVK
ncbi:hypothetical protein [Roseivirga sp. UBA838]|uniref:hypothetical protein n=1 Tax=Roseivirga sp. UBA838 TaxID=1947393 RepID=UPI00257F4DA2|nr:hypothetical protein [Roseivirga sp. UBA838]|tara:strand:- start:11193 stop:11642 length:450 start_codon:yes stop_codon:yes gene_type:complete